MSELQQALEDCLARLNDRQATLEECLARYPDHSQALQAWLTAAGRVEQGRSTRPSPAFKARARAQLINHMQAHPRRRPARNLFSRLPLQFSLGLGRAFNTAVGLVALLLLFLMTGTALAQTALPGDALYGWRKTSEQVWRSIHPNPLDANLTLSARRARDLVRVAGDPQAEPVARREYKQSLNELSAYTMPDTRQIISEALAAQKAGLDKARVTVPELEALLNTIAPPKADLALVHRANPAEAGLITYNLTITNRGPAGPATAVVTNLLSPAETVVSTAGANCAGPDNGVLTCTITDLVPDTPHTVTVTTAIDPCYAGVITNTATVTGAGRIANLNPAGPAVARTTISRPGPDQTQVVYVQSNGRTHSLGLVTATGNPINFDLHLRAAAPAWSPDGRRLAFFGEEGISELGGVYGSGNGIWLAQIAEGQVQTATQLVALDHVTNLAWSPDGTRLAAEVGPPGLHHEVVVIDANDGRELSRFSGEQPAWHPNSRQLVVKGCYPACGLWQVNPDGSSGAPLTTGQTDSYPAWSPTGQYLAFSSERAGNWEIYRLRPADGQLLRLTNRSGTDTTPVFDTCGQTIYLRTDDPGSWWLTAMAPDGSGERKVMEGIGPSEDWGLARPAIRPAGRIE